MARLKHILYVEDNVDDILLVKSALAERQVEIYLHVVVNAVLAFSFLAKQGAYVDAPTVDLVILDINLPIINGVKALNIIKTSPELRDIPVLILTSSERSEDRNLCLRMGVIAYHVKPKVWDEYLHLADTLKEAITTGCVAEPEPEAGRPVERMPVKKSVSEKSAQQPLAKGSEKTAEAVSGNASDKKNGKSNTSK